MLYNNIGVAELLLKSYGSRADSDRGNIKEKEGEEVTSDHGGGPFAITNEHAVDIYHRNLQGTSAYDIAYEGADQLYLDLMEPYTYPEDTSEGEPATPTPCTCACIPLY